MYPLLRSFLFKMDPEKAHALCLAALHCLPKFCFKKPKSSPQHFMGLDFSHPIGLAAGFDKNAQHLNALNKLGFSFIEIGTITPKGQYGNSKPRLFRVPSAAALINRMGFNNYGVESVIASIRKARYPGILGINIGKNKETALSHAANDYLYCLKKVYPYASYITINISSPNTPELRLLQQGEFFLDLLQKLNEEHLRLEDRYQRKVPLVVKISPDESDETIKKIAQIALQKKISGIIATNTTCSRAEINYLPQALETGGLSGAPLLSRSTYCLHLLKQLVGNDIVLIGSGGIDSLVAAEEKIRAGANLLQVYTGLIYKGPSLVQALSSLSFPKQT